MTTTRRSGSQGRRWLIYIHRWLGIAGSLVFLIWFVSGVVMMYERMPRLTAEERLARMTALSPARIRVSEEDASRTADLVPDRVRVSTIGERPVYRLQADGRWTTVYADTGEVLRDLSESEALSTAQRLWPEDAGSMTGAGRIAQPDQWTLDGGLPRFLPMQRLAMGDAAGTVVYVSARTGEAVMKTTARGRFWGYLGAVLHWTYFTPFRLQRELWRYSIIYAALIGCVLCLSGLVLGVWRFSPSKRFRLKRQASHSPYAGLLWWHHYAGLAFGLFSFTWALSGALSLTPWDWAPSTDATELQRTALTGGPLGLASAGPDKLSAAFALLSRNLPVKELEIGQFQGRAFALAYGAPTLSEAREASNPDVSAAFSSELELPRRLVWLDAPTESSERFSSSATPEAARVAMPDERVQDETWLTGYDSYYYDRWGGQAPAGAARPLCRCGPDLAVPRSTQRVHRSAPHHAQPCESLVVQRTAQLRRAVPVLQAAGMGCRAGRLEPGRYRIDDDDHAAGVAPTSPARPLAREEAIGANSDRGIGMNETILL